VLFVHALIKTLAELPLPVYPSKPWRSGAGGPACRTGRDLRGGGTSLIFHAKEPRTPSPSPSPKGRGDVAFQEMDVSCGYSLFFLCPVLHSLVLKNQSHENHKISCIGSFPLYTFVAMIRFRGKNDSNVLLCSSKYRRSDTASPLSAKYYEIIPNNLIA